MYQCVLVREQADLGLIEATHRCWCTLGAVRAYLCLVLIRIFQELKAITDLRFGEAI